MTAGATGGVGLALWPSAVGAEESVPDGGEGTPWDYHGLHPSHPFFPGIKTTIVTDALRHRSRAAAIIPLFDRWIIVYREAKGHTAPTATGKIVAAVTRNQGQTFESTETIWDEPDFDQDDVRGFSMGDGRAGVLARRYPVSGGTHLPVFLWSDDGGGTWQSRVLNSDEGLNAGIGFTVIPFPAELGGHDRFGYLAFMTQGGNIHALYTVDNGVTWTRRLIIDNSGNLLHRSFSEVSVVRLGVENKWLMVGRSHRSDSTPFFKSTDLINWDGPYFSGQFTGQNSMTIAYNKGHVTWLARSAWQYLPEGTRGIPVNGIRIEGLVSQTQRADRLWGDPTRWPGWVQLIALPTPHLDLTLVEYGGHWYGIGGVHEDRSEGPGNREPSQIGILSSVAAGPQFNRTRLGQTQRALVFLRNDFSVAANSFTTVKWNGTEEDVGGFFHSAHPDRLTVRETGIYRLGFGARLKEGHHSEFSIRIVKNGGVFRGQARQDCETNGKSRGLVCHTPLVEAEGGDYFTAEVWHDATDGRVSVLADESVWFAVERIDSPAAPRVPERV